MALRTCKMQAGKLNILTDTSLNIVTCHEEPAVSGVLEVESLFLLFFNI